MAFGPSSSLASGSLVVLIEHQVDYAVEATKKLQRERLKSIEVKKAAVQDFDEYLEVSNRFMLSRPCLRVDPIALLPEGLRLQVRGILYD